MTLLKFTDRDGNATGIDHRDVIGVRRGDGITLIDRRSLPQAALIVTEDTATVISEVRHAELLDQRQRQHDNAADIDLVDKRLRLAELQLATARLMPPPKGKDTR